MIKEHDLRVVAIPLEDPELTTLAASLEGLIVSSPYFLYPNNWPMPTIPYEQYDETASTEAIELATKILAIVYWKIYDQIIGKMIKNIFRYCQLKPSSTMNFVTCISQLRFTEQLQLLVSFTLKQSEKFHKILTIRKACYFTLKEICCRCFSGKFMNYFSASILQKFCELHF